MNNEQEKESIDISAMLPETESTALRQPKNKSGWKQTEEDYAARFLQPRKVKDYSPVYIDTRLKDKLNSLVSSLQYLSPDVTATVLLSNLLADHIVANKELIKRAANEGLKRSLENTFSDNDK